ncbi:MAG: helix-turn-helix domain-containing protein [Nitrospiraceae bacterium]|nr:helix-turn-helix domain-containing protein [Nitrospiraceae bacterium]
MGDEAQRGEASETESRPKVASGHPLSRVGPALRLLRERAGLVQQDVANRLGVYKGTVSRLEQSVANPTLETVGRYLMAIGATAQSLFEALRSLEPAPGEGWMVGSASTPEAPDIAREAKGLATQTLHRRVAFDLMALYNSEIFQIYDRLATLEAKLREKE